MDCEVRLDQGDLGPPGLVVDRRAARPASAASMSRPVGVDGVGGRARGRSAVSTASAVAVDPLDDPLEHPAVLAEAGPQERAVVALAEPVDPEQLRAACRRRWPRRSRASGRSSRPCCSRRTAAWRRGRSARSPTVPAAAAVFSELMIEPRNTPCCQSKASVTSGTLVARRPPKRMAEIGTPVGVLPLGGDRRALRRPAR